MSVRLSEEEIWEFVAAAHTGVVTTVRRDGWPISLPIWFVVRERRIYLTTPARTKKIARVRNDKRACFMVEEGEAWRDLKAVVMTCDARVVEDDEQLTGEVERMVQEKYGAFRMDPSELPERTARYYDQESAVVELTPHERKLSWENARLF